MECHPKTHQRDDQKALSDYVLIPSSHHRPRTFNRNDKRSVGNTGQTSSIRKEIDSGRPRGNFPHKISKENKK